MDNLVARWKHAMKGYDNDNETKEKSKERDTDKQKSHEKSNPHKKSLEKSKKSLHSNSNKESLKKLMTPSKSKKKSKKTIMIDEAMDEIIECLGKNYQDKFYLKIKNTLESLWFNAIQQNGVNLENEIQIRQSTVTSLSNRLPLRLYGDIERRYIESQKQKHYFKGQCESLFKRCEQVEKELERYGKIEKLIDSYVDKEQTTRKQMNRLRRQLEASQLKNIEQQKIFQREVITIHQLVQSIKGNLPDQ